MPTPTRRRRRQGERSGGTLKGRPARDSWGRPGDRVLLRARAVHSPNRWYSGLLSLAATTAAICSGGGATFCGPAAECSADRWGADARPGRVDLGPLGAEAVTPDNLLVRTSAVSGGRRERR